MEGGSTAMVFYDFTLGSTYTPARIVWLFGGIGLIMLILGLVRALELTYQPVVDYSRIAFGEKGTEELKEI